MCFPCGGCGFHDYDDVKFEGRSKRKKSKKKKKPRRIEGEVIQRPPVNHPPLMLPAAPAFAIGGQPAPNDPRPPPQAFVRHLNARSRSTTLPPLVPNEAVPGMNYSPQVRDSLRGPQTNLFLPFQDTPFGPQLCPPPGGEPKTPVPNPAPAPAPAPSDIMAGPMPPGHPSAWAWAQAAAAAGAGPGPGPGPPPVQPGPDFVQQFPGFNPNSQFQQVANINVNLNAGFNNAGFSAGMNRIPQQASFGPQIIAPPIPVQAANGQWLPGPYNRISPFYWGNGFMGAGNNQWAVHAPPPPQAIQAPSAPPPAPPPAPPAPPPAQAGNFVQAQMGMGPAPPPNVWVGPTQSQHMQNLLLRADRRPVEMCPADPDPWRFYLVKELDGGTTSRNRFTIDSGKIGKVIWYQTGDGSMYAVIVAPPPAEEVDKDD